LDAQTNLDEEFQILTGFGNCSFAFFRPLPHDGKFHRYFFLLAIIYDNNVVFLRKEYFMKTIISALVFHFRPNKSWILVVTLLIIGNRMQAQAPQGIPYQAVMRNADGSVMASSAVNLTFNIHDGSATGTVVYQESHALTSNGQGLVSCVVGNGVVSQGNFASIHWGVGAKFLHVMMGTTDLGTQQMLSVPYALYAGACDISVSASGDTLYSGNGNFVIIPGISAANANNSTIPTSGLGAVVLPGNNTCADQFISVVGCNGQTSLTYDGRTYDLVEIGGQCWFADNLATDQYRNGDAIPTGLDNATWSTTTSGAYSIYNNDPANDATYGKLYNWFTTADSRGLCPAGWHVPTDCEWMYLEGSLGMSSEDQQSGGFTRGTNEGGVFKATTNWNFPNTGAANSVSFTALPGGDRNASGPFNNNLYNGFWWTSSERDSNQAWNRELVYTSSMIFRGFNGDKHGGLSIRCLKDSEPPILHGCTDGSACNFLANATQDDGSCLYPNATCDDDNVNTVNDVINGECVCAGSPLINGTYAMGSGVTDIEGNFYPSIIINGQEWMQKNLAVTKYRNGDLIPTGLDNTTWQNTTSGAYAIYNNDPANNTIYGKLYNWYAVNDSRGACPTGWHVPSDGEWTFLINYLDPNQDPNVYGVQSAIAGGKLKSTIVWSSPNTGATDETGFQAVPAGFRGTDGGLIDLGYYGNYWSSIECNSTFSWKRRLYYSNSNINRECVDKRDGYSVRCLKD
jgi:uncharacterized protein (TIGR02145 family)